jgi:hypothetical protein
VGEEFKDIRATEAGGEEGTGIKWARNLFPLTQHAEKRKDHVAPFVRTEHEPLRLDPRSAVYSGIMN